MDSRMIMPLFFQRIKQINQTIDVEDSTKQAEMVPEASTSTLPHSPDFQQMWLCLLSVPLTWHFQNRETKWEVDYSHLKPCSPPDFHRKLSSKQTTATFYFGTQSERWAFKCVCVSVYRWLTLSRLGRFKHSLQTELYPKQNKTNFM